MALNGDSKKIAVIGWAWFGGAVFSWCGRLAGDHGRGGSARGRGVAMLRVTQWRMVQHKTRRGDGGRDVNKQLSEMGE